MLASEKLALASENKTSLLADRKITRHSVIAIAVLVALAIAIAIAHRSYILLAQNIAFGSALAIAVADQTATIATLNTKTLTRFMIDFICRYNTMGPGMYVTSWPIRSTLVVFFRSFTSYSAPRGRRRSKNSRRR